MIDGLILGVLTWLSLLLSWWHMPQPIKTLTKKHPVLTDLSVGLFTFMVLSGISKSIVAVIGSVVTGLLVNFTIIIGNRFNNDSIRLPGHDPAR